jgi:hypothetical protein
MISARSSRLPTEFLLRAHIRYFWLLLTLLLLTLIPTPGSAQPDATAKPANPVPEPAISAILAAFDKYEVVGLPQGHGNQDLDQFIFSLIRNPGFWRKVNDIVFECGNSPYQPVLDRYIAGEDISFHEVQRVWRNMGQPTCAASGFVEQFYPLVRALNQKLPPDKRLRVLAPDPAVDWDQINGIQDLIARHFDRETSIASVMEKEVLSKHRKALMLFGTLHLMHGARNAVSLYEKSYPNLTFIVTDLGFYDTDLKTLAESKFINWPIPALALAKGTWLGPLNLDHLLPAPVIIDQDCKVQHGFPKPLQKPMEELVDAFLYLGPQELVLKEKIPADIALDESYRPEFQRGGAMMGLPNAASEIPKEFDREIVDSAADPLFVYRRPLRWTTLKLFKRVWIRRLAAKHP